MFSTPCAVITCPKLPTQQLVLGPLLFLLYANDIQYVVKGSKNNNFFADDTNLFLYNTHVDKLFEIANMNMSQYWFTVKRLNLNLDKTCYSRPTLIV